MMARSSRRCVVHIGAPKTGSTALQRFCHAQRDRLRMQGVDYPLVNLRGGGHHDLAFLLDGGYPEWATPQPKSLAELQLELIRSLGDEPTLLLSSENFFLLPHPERLAQLLRDCDLYDDNELSIVVYLRRQDMAHASWYNQTIKAQGAVHTLEDCLEHWDTLWDYRAQLERWSAVFGEDALCVRRYTEDGPPGWLFEDFLQVLGVDPATFDIPATTVNGGLNRSLLEFQRTINRLPLETQDKRRYHRELIELSARSAGSGLFDERPLLDDAARRRILERYAEGNAEVARRYFGGEPLFPSTVAAGPRPGGTASSPGEEAPLSEARMAAILGWLLTRSAEAADPGTIAEGTPR
ncbi:hypothetical protein ABI59_13305 [Acidobacteria bacterium Mor1]|nr:hypothetical protein ABI59_13305 [Acidobacteria bacterium Mor1]